MTVTFMKDNIVLAVILISAIIWIPLSCIINNYDQKEREELNRRSASLSSRGSGRRVTRNFSRKHTRPGMRTRRTGLRSESRTVSHQTRSQSQQIANPYANPMYESVLWELTLIFSAKEYFFASNLSHKYLNCFPFFPFYGIILRIRTNFFVINFLVVINFSFYLFLNIFLPINWLITNWN